MPLDAWVLLFCAVGFGLTLELAFYLRQRRNAAAADAGGEPGLGSGSDDPGGAP